LRAHFWTWLAAAEGKTCDSYFVRFLGKADIAEFRAPIVHSRMAEPAKSRRKLHKWSDEK
jgi:hypothetical protein